MTRSKIADRTSETASTEPALNACELDDPLTAIRSIGKTRYGELAKAGYVTFRDVRDDPDGVGDVATIGDWLAARLRRAAGVDARCSTCGRRFAHTETAGSFDGSTARYRCPECGHGTEGPPPA